MTQNRENLKVDQKCRAGEEEGGGKPLLTADLYMIAMNLKGTLSN